MHGENSQWRPFSDFAATFAVQRRIHAVTLIETNYVTGDEQNSLATRVININCWNSE